jgi:tRNA threonylcarbamoyladenosine biosynthesis protein TsaB
VTVLYVDTTYDTTLGLLSEKLEWLEVLTLNEKRASNILQSQTYKILEEHQLQIDDLTRIVICAGPGFYTGLRLSEGFSDIFKLFNVNSCSFYSYDLPKILGVPKGCWITKAYRGEYFCHSWGESVEKSELFSFKELPAFDEAYFHSETAVDDLIKQKCQKLISTNDLLKSNSQVIFEHILKLNQTHESYYFRAPEDEFRMNP